MDIRRLRTKFLLGQVRLLPDWNKHVGPPRYAEVLTQYFSGGKPITFLAHHYAVSRQRISAIIHEAIERLVRAGMISGLVAEDITHKRRALAEGKVAAC